MKPTLLALTVALWLTGPTTSPAQVGASDAPVAGLSAEARGVLDGYEKVRAALAADKFADAQTRAKELAEAAAARPETPGSGRELAVPAEAVAKSANLKTAREAFKPLSATAIQLAKGTPGFVVVNCPMTPKGDWLQTNAKISNPYYGREMLECGVVKK